MKNLIKVSYKEGFIICRSAKLNEGQEYSIKNAELLQKAFGGNMDDVEDEKKIKDYHALAMLDKLNSDYLLSHVIEVEDIIDTDDTKVTLEMLQEGHVSRELYNALANGHKEAQKQLAESAEGKSKG